MEQTERIFTAANRPGMFSDDKIQSGIDMETNKPVYSEVLEKNEDLLTLRHLANKPNRENILLDSPVFLESKKSEIPIRYFNHMPVKNELLALEYRGKLDLADVTNIDFKEGIIHVEQRLSTVTHSQNRRYIELQNRLLRDYKAYTANQLAVLQNNTVDETQAYLDEQESKHTVFTVDNNGVTLYPAFLFNDKGKVRKVIGNLVQVFKGSFTGWAAWAWFCLPTGLLSGNVPIDIAHTDFKRAFIAVKRKHEDLTGPRY